MALTQLPLVLVEQDAAAGQRALQIALINAQKNPSSAPALATLGWVRFRLGKNAEAEEDLKRAVTLSGNNIIGETLFFLTQVLLTNSKAAEAEPYVGMLQAAVEQLQLFILRNEARKWLKSVALAFDK